MAEQLSSSASTTDCDDVVKIPKYQYMRAVAQMKQQRMQIVAQSNLHRLMRDKEKEMMACKDKNEQLQLTLQQSEARLSNVIRLQAAAAAAATSIPETPETHALERDDAGTEVEFLQQHMESDDVVEDGEAITQRPRCSQLSSSVAKLTETPAYKIMTLRSFADSDLPITAVVSHPVMSPSAAVSSASVDMSATHVTCLASSVTAPTLAVSSAASSQSKDLLDKVLQQNARLKKTLRDLLSQKGLSVSTYLDRQEYEDAAEILRHDLADAQKRIGQLKSFIASRNNGDIDRIMQDCSRLADKVAILERKLAISQAYADALKQAHDKCRHEGSHVETNTESSASYAQVLEELEKVKGHCKDYEMKNTTLHTEIEALQQQLKANEESMRELDKLKSENLLLVEERQLNKTQIAAYEEDFKMEQKEKQEQQNKYEINIAKHQEWVRRLAVEAQKCRASWQEEIAKREELEQKLRSVQSGNVTPSEWTISKCSSAVSSKLASLPLVDIRMDGPQDSSVEDDHDKQRLVCPRCEREFPYTETSRWEQHCKRCTND